MQGGHPLLVQISVRIDGRESGVVEQMVSGTAAEIEEQARVIEQRGGADDVGTRVSADCRSSPGSVLLRAKDQELRPADPWRVDDLR